MRLMKKCHFTKITLYKFLLITLIWCVFIVFIFNSYKKNHHQQKYSSISKSKIDQNDNNFVINPGKRVCGKSKGKTHLIVSFTPLSVDYFKRRELIRRTWCSNEKRKGIKNIFVVGLSLNTTINKQLLNESQVYGDILQINVLDTFQSLTNKTVFGIKWMSEYCDNAKFIMKIDDDMVVNLHRVIEYFKLKENDSSTKSSKIYGHCKHKYMFPKRDRKNKHYISREDYAPDLWPPYCHGPAYVLTRDTLRPLYNLTKYIRQFPMEDTFVGLLAQQLHIDLIDVKDWIMIYPAHQKSVDEIVEKKVKNYFFVNVGNLGKNKSRQEMFYEAIFKRL
jgi:beta-1,3-galactosyltransferase 2